MDIIGIREHIENSGVPVNNDRRGSYKVITSDQKLEWNKYVTDANSYDFYHSWYYHQLDPIGEPLLFVFEQGYYFIIIPLLKREIKGTPYYDCTSVYGYPGPITNLPEEFIDENVIKMFRNSLISYFKSADIISGFFRFHPILNQSSAWEYLGDLITHGRTITIDIKQTIGEQRRSYRRTLRSNIKHLNDHGLIVREAKDDTDLLEFVSIYHVNMKRVEACSYYYFDVEYFRSLIGSPEFVCKLFLCYDKKKVTSGALITFSNKIMQLHLCCTSEEYLHLAPLKLLIDEITVYGRTQGMQYLHMGGGVGGNEDSLFQFKAGFSDMKLPFKTWRLISNQQVYDQLVQELVKEQTGHSNFFPLYRESPDK